MRNHSESYLADLDYMLSIFPRADIKQEDKLLWLCLVSHCVKRQLEWCVFSYQELAVQMGWNVNAICGALQRMQLWGFLNSEIPFSQGVVTVSAALIQRKLSPTLPERKQPMMEMYDKKTISINLLKYKIINN